MYKRKIKKFALTVGNNWFFTVLLMFVIFIIMDFLFNLIWEELPFSIIDSAFNSLIMGTIIYFVNKKNSKKKLEEMKKAGQESMGTNE